MGKRIFKSWLGEYIDYTRHSESPTLFHFWTGVFTIAGALRRQVWRDELLFQWTPNFYITLVGPPGIAAKSTTLRLGTNLLKKVEGVHFGPDSMTWQALTDSLQEAATLVETPHQETNDPLLKSMLPMSCISCSVKELGTFLRPEDKDLTSVLIDLWDGQLETWVRKTRYKEGNVEIENPWINVMGCTTPSWLQDNFSEHMIGGGLVSRMVFVYGDSKRKLVAYPSKQYKSKEWKDQGKQLVEDLNQIATLVGPFDINDKGLAWGEAWYKNHWKEKPDHMVSERFGGYLARKQTHIHKLAMVIAVSKRDELVMTKEDLMYADEMVTQLEGQMTKVFENIGVGDLAAKIKEVLAHVFAYKEIPKQTLHEKMLMIMTPREFEDATTACINAGKIILTNKGGVATYIKKEKKDD